MINTQDKSLENNIIKDNEINNHLIILNNFKTNIFNNLLDFFGWTIDERTKKWIIQKLNDRFLEIYVAYLITEEKFKYRKRDSWEMYITHINWVLDIYINKLFNLKNKLNNLDNQKEDDRKKAIEYVKNEICIIWTIIEHDSIEDTDATMEWLNERYTINKLVWFTTLLLSKKPFAYCINNEDDKKLFLKIKKAWVLNEKWLKSDLIKSKIQVSIENSSIDTENINEVKKWIKNKDNLISYTFHDDHELTDEQIKYIELYEILEKKYKNSRNEMYFQHYKSIYSLIKHAKNLLKNSDIYYSKEDFKIIIHNTIIIKLADRIHNLNDLPKSWKYNCSKIEKKLIETEKYLLPIAKEFNNDIFEFIKNEIIRIRIEINKKSIDEIIK